MEKLYGLIGERLGHTYSPLIHREILKEIGIKGHYGLFQVESCNLKYTVSGLKALSYNGVNITIPYKTEIIKYLDNLSAEAEKIGAVNVINIDKSGISTGYNTDYHGFGMMLDNANIKIKNERAVILGTGGASKAVIQYLKDNGARDILLVTRDIDTAAKKYPDDRITTYNDLNRLKDYSIIINSTPVGMHPNIDFSPVDSKFLKGFSYAIDLIYNPSQTLFLKLADEEGLKTINGLYMLIAQAVKSQEIWNDIKIPLKIIDTIIDLLRSEKI